MKYYRQSVGEVVSQVYEVEAGSWQEAKKAAFDDMKEGDILAECEPSAVVTNSQFEEYSEIKQENCASYARLYRGAWMTEDGEEYWNNSVWYFDDDEDTLIPGAGFIVSAKPGRKDG